MSDNAVLLTVAEMAEADHRAITGGVAGQQLMEAAGAAVARMVQRHHPHGSVLVLCGPGNNGGDGFVAARLLAAAGRNVAVMLLGEVSVLRGDAAVMAKQWTGLVAMPAPALVAGHDVIVDALFGAGLGKPLSGAALALVEAVNASGKPIVAVDLPSGLHGDDGQPRGVAIRATRTVTFFRPKPGHLLLPGRQLCGHLHVADIGIPADVLNAIKPRQWQNDPALWRAALPALRVDGHKYARGHVLVRGGALAGAARLAGHAALRIGAGLVTLAQPREALLQGGGPDALMRQACEGIPDWRHAIADARRNVLLLGPGNGAGAATAQAVRDALARKRAVVLDADALTCFADDPKALFRAIAGSCILTPHDGEFARLFPDLAPLPKLERARQAAKRSKAVIVLKGADTVIASPDGRLAINANAPPDLATAGAGDVLAGFCAGLLAQAMPVFEAACAAVWLHGAAATTAGPGLIADDLPLAVRLPLARLRHRGA
ncbi:NAD(P)H-hydrate dehydratase [Ferrovibrio sp.]|uniref:NAD(P)H-hydrate dehydratase n=1 Tax=Ferrovibrio sp. TaxID=1917215 RepID=UPI002627D94D|nr:NAD(P)H-hydrate dehydratase [Ferrovibrio sp.]